MKKISEISFILNDSINKNNKEEMEKYLSDLDNLLDTILSGNEDIGYFTFHHKGMGKKDFLNKGREYIGTLLKIVR